MKKSRFSEEKIVKILREADRSPVTHVAKKYGGPIRGSNPSGSCLP